MKDSDSNPSKQAKELDAANMDDSKEVIMKPKFRESDAGDGTTREDQILTGTRFYLCAASLLLCLFLVALDQMITAAILTTIANDFKAFNKLTWITASFMMPLGCCAQVWGRLSISFGRRWTMVTGIVLFEIGSLVAALSNSMDMFIGGRSIQGVGGSCIQTIVMVIAAEITTIDKKPLLFASLSIMFVVASVIGPLVGGSLGAYTTWRWCFWINICCAGLIFPFFLYSYRPKPPVSSFKEKLKTVDLLDNFLMIASCVLVLLAISFGTTETTWRSASVICCFIIGGLLMATFCLYNFKYSKFPAIPRNIVSVPTIMAAFGSYTFNYSTVMVFAQFLSIYVQNVLHHNAFHTGLFIIPCAIASSISAICNGIIIRQTSQIKIFSVLANVLLPISTGLMILLDTKENLGYIIGFEILLGVASGLNFQGPMMSSMIKAPKTPSSTILTAAFLNFGRSTGTALFSEIGGAIYMESLKSGMRKIAPDIEETQYPLETILYQTTLLEKLSVHDENLILGQIMKSVRNVFWMGLAMSFMALICSIFMSNAKLPKSEDVEA
ncbi:hypothetical protein FOA43_001287 [Brettanomyces nanus]|uniref:Major facilitator superfamily (MFS) profile domain-containing protein n=1 Tax=Eeniella nana TaxID=13502 RepID=A0A875RX35_EENNA|nr:uncharacterized protein FOA43_001287 [Brettanomyces nanus]QPG73971.1 hypothetical protein FOA43_001287 [Brettanomyces nanus]